MNKFKYIKNYNLIKKMNKNNKKQNKCVNFIFSVI